jgi:hypothetical protein
MYAIKAKTVGKQDVIFDHDCYVAGMGNFTQGIGGARQGIFVAGGEAKAQARDGVGVQHGFELCAEGFKLKGRRGDEVDLRALCFGHVSCS